MYAHATLGRMSFDSLRTRAVPWFRAHRALLVDCLETALLMLLWFSMSAGFIWNNGAGLFLDYPSSSGWAPLCSAVWSVLLTAPYLLHRVRPRTSAHWFIVTVVIQLVFGPSLVIADFMAVPMLCAAIVHGERTDVRRYLITAGVLDVVTSLVNAWVQVFGPLRPSRSADDLDAYFVCPVLSPAHRAVCGRMFGEAFVIVLVSISLPLAMAVIVAFWQRARQQTVVLLNERNNAIVAREQEERQIAASAERARIARDMHDIVAHTLSIIIIQSDGGRYAARDDAELARGTMETIRRESERALHDMKRLLGVFGGSPHADITDIDALIDQARAVSPDMTLTVRTIGQERPSALSEQASVAMYHVVQEALTNIRKYAGAHVGVTVTVRWDVHTLTIDIDDDGRGAASSLDGHKPGYGLLGMRERIGAVGGTVASGPRLSGGFNVHASVPLGQGVPEETDGSETSAPASEAMRVGTGDTTVRAADATSGSDGALHNADGTADDVTDGDITAGDGTTPPQRHAPDERIIWPFFVKLGDKLRSKPFEQDEDDSPCNWISRMSRWTQRHYVLMDVVMFTLLGCVTSLAEPVMFLGTPDNSPRMHALGVFVTWCIVTPLMLRRRFPRAVAAAVAAICLLQLLALPGFYTADLYVLFAIYAVALYGKAGSWKWVVPLFTLGCVVFAARCAMNVAGYRSLFAWLSHTPEQLIDAGFYGSPDAAFIQYGAFALFFCVMAYALGAWTKLGGTNPQVLQARAEALEAERDKQRIIAANHERDRISANIRSEVSDTLNAVIEQTTTELSTIDDDLAHGRTPSPEFITDAFAQIGAQGRTALAHMRELLSVLRETGFSDEGDHDRTPNLTPARPLNEQLRRTGGAGRARH